MRAVGRVTKYVVANKVDKDGNSAPSITVTFEVPFLATHVNSLADLTDGEQVTIALDHVQGALFERRSRAAGE